MAELTHAWRTQAGPWLRLAWRQGLGWVIPLSAVLLLVLPPLAQHFSRSLDPLLMADDARQQIAPFYRYLSGGPTAPDFLGDYYLANYPIGYFALYATAAKLGADPLWLSTLLPYPLLLVVATATGATAYRFGGRPAAIAAAVLVLGIELCLSRMTGGLPRSFGFPLVAAALACLAWGRIRLLAGLSVLAPTFYPVAGVLCGLTLAAVALLPGLRTGSDIASMSFRRRLGLVAVAGAMAVAVVVPAALGGADYGRILTAQDTRDYPEVGEGGRYGRQSRPPFPGLIEQTVAFTDRSLFANPAALAPPVQRFWRSQLEPDGRSVELGLLPMVLRELLLLLVVVSWTRLCVRRVEARRLSVFALVCAIGHMASRFVAPYLYLPERYLVLSLPLLLAILLSVAPTALLGAGLGRTGAWARALGTALLVLLFAGLPRSSTGVEVDLRADRALMESIAATPPESVIAGWPKGVMDSVPLATQRVVLLNFESHQAFHQGFVEQARSRMHALQRAYFATDAEPIRELQRRYGVTHILVTLDHFRRPPRYFRPFGKMRLPKRDRLGDFLLYRAGRHQPLYRNKRYAFIALKDVLSSN